MKKLLLVCALMCSSLAHSAEMKISYPKYISHKQIGHSDGYDAQGKFTGTNLYRALFEISLDQDGKVKKYTVPVIFSQTETTKKLDFYSTEKMSDFAPHDSLKELQKDKIDLDQLDKQMPEIVKRLLPYKL